MSDGMSDGRRLEDGVRGLRTAAGALDEALQEIVGGVRGWAVEQDEIERIVNECLFESGWTIQRPQRGGAR